MGLKKRTVRNTIIKLLQKQNNFPPNSGFCCCTVPFEFDQALSRFPGSSKMQLKLFFSKKKSKNLWSRDKLCSTLGFKNHSDTNILNLSCLLGLRKRGLPRNLFVGCRYPDPQIRKTSGELKNGHLLMGESSKAVYLVSLTKRWRDRQTTLSRPLPRDWTQIRIIRCTHVVPLSIDGCWAGEKAENGVCVPVRWVTRCFRTRDSCWCLRAEVRPSLCVPCAAVGR